MHEPSPTTDLLRDPRLAPLAFSAVPAWLWSGDGTRILWSNAAGAATFRAASPAALAGLSFERDALAVREVQRLRGSLAPGGAVQLARLRGFSSSVGGMLTCACRRIRLADNSAGILIAATEPAKPPLPLSARVRQMLGDAEVAIFGTDGDLLHAEPAASARLAGRITLRAIGAEAIGAEALAAGIAGGDSHAGPLRLERLGGGDAVVLLATFEHRAAAATPAPPAASMRQAAPPASDSHAATPRTGAAFDDAELRLVARHHPLRFVWRMDADTRFSIEAGDFTMLAGEPTTQMLDRPWAEIAAALALDPGGQMIRAIASHDTWSGIAVAWPAEGCETRLPVVLSGLPVLTRDHGFNGYRGFGVCRDVARIAAVIAGRRAAPARGRPEQVPAAAAEPEESDDPFAQSPFAAADEPPPPATDAAEPALPAPAGEPRPRLTVVPAVRNVVPLRAGQPADKRPALSSVERSAFQEIARALGAPPGAPPPPPALPDTTVERPAVEPHASTAAAPAIPPEAEPASLPSTPTEVAAPTPSVAAADPPDPVLAAARTQVRELRSILDTATDGVIVVDTDGRIESGNLSAQALFGYDGDELAGRSLLDLFAPESQRSAADYLEGLTRSGVLSLLNDGREVIGRVREGGLIPLFMTMGRIGDTPAKFCAVFRDLTQWKRAEEDLVAARRQAEHASRAKSDFLAKISHELRTPLNAIIGFAELMMEERLGPLGDERYRAYLKDMRGCGAQVVAMLDDLVDLAKIEAGRLDLNFTRVDLNEVMQQAVASMQPQANRERIIIRTALSQSLPAVVADARSMRQIVINLLSNSIKFTGAGGQVIVSTALTDAGEAVMRVRDTGVGMSEKQIEAALEPFRQIQVSLPALPSGAGLGLPLTKALAEANRASFQIKSAVNAGTLVEIIFPPTRVLAE